MNAIEFVKECGIDVAKRTLNNAIDFGCAEIELFGGKYVFRTDDIKQIVDALELVERFGGIERIKRSFHLDESCNDEKILTIHGRELEKAINLVESVK